MNVAGLPARRAALTLLTRVLWQQRPLETALDGALNSLTRPEDRALARAIASETLRWLIDLDTRIDAMMKKPLPPDARARMVLRMALAQKLILGTPDHAVLATTLPLVESGPRRLVHGVLSSLFKRCPPLPDAPTLPESFESNWRQAYGDAALAAIKAAAAKPAPLDLCLKNPAQSMEGELLFSGCVRLSPQDVASLPGFAQGDWWVQDAAAQLPALLLEDVPGLRVLDLCAAPGGKTMQLAARGAQVTALDISEKRLQLLRDNLKRTGLEAEVVCANALDWSPKQPFDAILLDAPCSATGTMRRHPDVLHLRDGMPLDDLVTLQRELLGRAAQWLNPGGRLVYAVCSMEPEEGEAQAEWAKNNLAMLIPEVISDDALPIANLATGNAYLRMHSGSVSFIGGCDGFFMARWRRVA